VLNWRRRLTQVDLYDGCKMVVVVVIILQCKAIVNCFVSWYTAYKTGASKT